MNLNVQYLNPQNNPINPNLTTLFPPNEIFEAKA